MRELRRRGLSVMPMFWPDTSLFDRTGRWWIVPIVFVAKRLKHRFEFVLSGSRLSGKNFMDEITELTKGLQLTSSGTVQGPMIAGLTKDWEVYVESPPILCVVIGTVDKKARV